MPSNNNTLENWQFRLIGGNINGSNIKKDSNGVEIENSVQTSTIHILKDSSVTVAENHTNEQHVIENNNALCSFQVYVDDYPQDIATNYYTWIIKNYHNNNTPEEVEIASYFFNNNNVNTIPGYAITKTKANDKEIHTLQISNNIIKNLESGEKIQVYLQVQNLKNYIENKFIKSEPISCYYQTNAPWISSLDRSRINVIISNSENNQFELNVDFSVIANSNNNLSRAWFIKDNQSNLSPLDAFLQENSNIFTSTFNNPVLQTNNNNNNINNYQMQTIIVINPGKANDALDILKDKQIGIQIINTINNVQYKSSIKYFDFLTILNPISIISSWINNASNIIGLQEQNSTATFSITSQNATDFRWQILPPNEQEPISLSVSTRSGQSSTASDEQYSVSCSASGSTLTIAILGMNTQNEYSTEQLLRDNGTKIRCYYSNIGTEEPEAVPGTNEWSEITVTYPMQVISPAPGSSGMWWPIANESKKVCTIQILIPASYIETLDNENALTFSSTTQILSNVDGYKYSLAETSKDALSIMFDNLTTTYDESGNLVYTCNLLLTCTNGQQLAYKSGTGGIPIVYYTISDLDGQYSLVFTITAKYQKNKDFEIINTFEYPVVIRQCRPLINQSSGGLYGSYEIYDKIFQPTDNDIIEYFNNEQPTPENPLILDCEDSRIFSLKYNSVQLSNQNTGLWLLSGQKANPATTKLVSIPSPKNQYLIIEHTTSGSESQYSGPFYLGINSGTVIGNMTIGGYANNLFIQAANPWGVVVSKRLGKVTSTQN